MNALKDRLTKLRLETGSTPKAVPEVDNIRTLRERIEQLRVRGQGAKPLPQRDDANLAKVLGGRLVQPGLIIIDQRIAPNAWHGDTLILGDLGERVSRLLGLPVEGDSNIAFLDTETTGLAGGTGTVAFMVGLARPEGSGLLIRQLLLTAFEGEPALLEALKDWLNNTHVLVSFNGKSFDAPLLSTRFRLLGRVDPLPSLQHLDLLHLVRRAFSDRWRDCRLQTAEKKLLGFARVDDLPGSEAPAAWLAWLRQAQSGMLKRVAEHNYHDLVSMIAMVGSLEACYRDPLAWHANPLAPQGLAAPLVEKHYDYLVANQHRLEEPALVELARWARRRCDWPISVAIWQVLSDRAHPEALARLAKYYEHVARDLNAALRYTETLLKIEPHEPDHAHRARRLERKLRAHSA